MDTSQIPSRTIVTSLVHATSYEQAARCVIDWAAEHRPRTVVAANVHVIMEAHDSADVGRAVDGADLVTADGVPLVWALRLMGCSGAPRVYGPDLTLHVCEAAARAGVAVGLYGSTPDCLDRFAGFLERRFPGISIACRISPPFRPLTVQEDEEFTRRILGSGTRILLVGLGCPKQELWMARHRESLPLVMLGVGVAFDFHAGRIRQAPRWVMRIGLEWLFRLCVEPRRLWKRYVLHNPRFVWLTAKQMLAGRAAAR
jgi:N-acetylglucosaminyldiphosphoundecaprenol N-acetyl-beta-D-mannosaminyltransferase